MSQEECSLKTHTLDKENKLSLDQAITKDMLALCMHYGLTVAACKTQIRSLAYFLTSVPLKSLGMYISSVICTVRPKSTNTALSDIRTMLLAKENRENNSYGTVCQRGCCVQHFQCLCFAGWLLR